VYQILSYWSRVAVLSRVAETITEVPIFYAPVAQTPVTSGPKSCVW